MESVFNYQISIDFSKINKNLKEKVGSSWAIVEKFLFPDSFVSVKGAFMFKIKEDEENSIDSWLLIIPTSVEILIPFLKGYITYENFLSTEGNEFYILKWNLQKFIVYADQKVSFLEIKEYIDYILDQKILPENEKNIEKIVHYIKNSFITKNIQGKIQIKIQIKIRGKIDYMIPRYPRGKVYHIKNLKEKQSSFFRREGESTVNSFSKETSFSLAA